MNGFQKMILSLSKLVYPSVVYGEENLPEGGALIVSNHLSDVDSAFIRRLFKNDGVFILAKKELFKNKLFGKILASYGAIPVNRENPDMKTLLTAANVLRRNDKLVIFPEGTRNRAGKTWLLPFKGGSFVLAAKSKKPIVPIVILRKAKIFRKTPIIIGKPFELTEFYGKKLSDDDISEMSEIVVKKLTELKSELENILSEKKLKKKTGRKDGKKSFANKNEACDTSDGESVSVANNGDVVDGKEKSN